MSKYEIVFYDESMPIDIGMKICEEATNCIVELYEKIFKEQEISQQKL